MMISSSKKITELSNTAAVFVQDKAMDGLVTAASMLADFKQNGAKSWHIPNLVVYTLKLWKFPLAIFYFCWVTLPVWIVATSGQLIWILVEHASAKNEQVKKALTFIEHVCNHCRGIFEQFVASQFARLVIFCLQTIFEIMILLLWPFDGAYTSAASRSGSRSSSLNDLASLEEYEEQQLVAGQPEPDLRSLRMMHHKIPTNLFRATVRMKRSRSDSSASSVGNPYQLAIMNNKSWLESPFTTNSACALTTPSSSTVATAQDIHPNISPASFPCTPFSRAAVMNKSADRVVGVMFAARDLLRLEAQSVCKDEYGRKAAEEALATRQFAVFDPKQSSPGIALSCGNHCAMKVSWGEGSCCCCRSMVPVRTNAYVYMEISITVSHSQIPTVGIGFAPLDSPLSVMVGSWPNSAGLYSDGQFFVGSEWFASATGQRIDAGSTVGVLMYIPDPEAFTNSVAGTTASNNNINSSSSNGASAVGVADKPNPLPHMRTRTMSAAGMYKEDPFMVRYNINGQPVDLPPEAMHKFLDAVDTGSPLFPTLTLFSQDTRCWCRFCEADIVFKSRDAVGAPAGKRVYCLDGSLLLSETDY